MKYRLALFLDRFKIRVKLLIVILPPILLGYIALVCCVTTLMFNNIKSIITVQTEQNISEKLSRFDGYLENLDHATDSLMYGYTMQNDLITEQSALPEDKYNALNLQVQNSVHAYLTQNNMALNELNIKNVYIQNTYGEIFVTDALRNTNAERVTQFFKGISPAAQKLHGKVYLFFQSSNLYFIRTVYQNDLYKVSTIESEKPIGALAIQMDIRFVSDLLENNGVNGTIDYVLADNNGNVVYNGSQLTLTQCRQILKTQSVRTGSQLYRAILLDSRFSSYHLIGIIDETALYGDCYRIFTVIIFISIASVILMVAFVIFASNTISARFQRLIQIMDRTNSFDDCATIDVGSNDEFKEFANGYNRMVSRVRNLSDTIHKKELAVKNSEIKAIRAQINPHFLYNTLDCISSLAGMGKIKETQQTITALSTLLRNTVKGNEMIQVKEEINFVNQYLYIERIRYKNRISFLVDVSDTIMDFYMPKLVLQPIIENAIIHGMANMLSDGFVAVLGREEGGLIIFEIRDNGSGIPDSVISALRRAAKIDTVSDFGTQKGVGLINLQRRIQIIYGEKYVLNLSRLPNGGTSVQIKFPKCKN